MFYSVSLSLPVYCIYTCISVSATSVLYSCIAAFSYFSDCIQRGKGFQGWVCGGLLIYCLDGSGCFRILLVSGFGIIIGFSRRLASPLGKGMVVTGDMHVISMLCHGLF